MRSTPVRGPFGAYLESHFLAARALLPVLRRREGASYTLVTGAAGEAAVPGADLLVTVVMAQFGLSRRLRAEHRSDAVRVNELRIYARIEKQPRPGVIPSREAGRIFITLAASEVRSAVVTLRRPEDTTTLPVAPGL